MGHLAGETMIPTVEAWQIIAAQRPISVRAVQRYIKDGRLEGVPVRGRYLTSKEAVERFLVKWK